MKPSEIFGEIRGKPVYDPRKDESVDSVVECIRLYAEEHGLTAKELRSIFHTGLSAVVCRGWFD